MGPEARKRVQDYSEKLSDLAPLENYTGLNSEDRIKALAEQIVESERRVEYVKFIGSSSPSEDVIKGNSAKFNPLYSSIYNYRRGNVDEAFWLVFLFVHFGKHIKDKWNAISALYGAYDGSVWCWERIQNQVPGFRAWLRKNEGGLPADARCSRRFGNHRRYTSWRDDAPAGTGEAVQSYINWVVSAGGHLNLIKATTEEVGQNPTEIFDYLYKTMPVKGFGRLGKFDYLCALSNLGLAPVAPGMAYLRGATGPLSGASLLVDNNKEANLGPEKLEARLRPLSDELNINMQIVEDSLCNWQKSPDQFVPFRG